MKLFKQPFILAVAVGLLVTIPSCAQNSRDKKTDQTSGAEAATELSGQAADDPSGIKWVSLKEAQAEAAETGKKVLIFGYADWCTYCMKMRKETYTDERVRKALYTDFIPVQLNAEAEKEVTFNGDTYRSWELGRYLRLQSFPTHYFIDSDGTILGAQPGFLPAEIFAPLMSYIGEDQFGKVKFEDYLKEKENIIIDQEGDK